MGTPVAIVEASAVLDDAETAASHYPAVAALCSDLVIGYASLGRLAETAAGIAAASADRWRDAEAHFERAQAQAEEIPHRPEQADIRRWHAWMLLRRDRPGDRDRARLLLGEAIEQYRAMGMPKHIEIAETMRTKVV